MGNAFEIFPVGIDQVQIEWETAFRFKIAREQNFIAAGMEKWAPVRVS